MLLLNILYERKGKMDTFLVSLSLEDTAAKIYDNVTSSVTGSQLDSYDIKTPDGKKCTVLVFEKYFYRVGNYVTLTVVLDNFDGKTRVHAVSGGGGHNLINFDWGASDSFVSKVMDELEEYRI